MRSHGARAAGFSVQSKPRSRIFPDMLLVVMCLGVNLVQSVFGVKMLELEAPASIMRGEPMTLNCTYDLEGDILYSIKWYKNNVEFYRYLPSDNPPGQRYALRGIYLDPKFLHGKSVYLNKTDLNSEGSYRCEVSAEAPSFQTVMDEKEIRVYVLPDKGPAILGSKSRYRIGEEVNVTCMSGPSKPPSFLQWYINGKEAPPRFVNRVSPLRLPDGLLSSMLALRFAVEPIHFGNGAMKLRCTDFISKAYSTTRSEIIATNKAKKADQKSALNKDGPTIVGGRERYQEGNVVNVNCTAAKIHPPAELRWYINDKEANRDYLRSYQDSSVLGLRFTVKARHFQRGEMRLKCTATFFKVTNKNSEEMVISNHQQSSGLQVYFSRGKGFNRASSYKIDLRTFLVLIILMAISQR